MSEPAVELRDVWLSYRGNPVLEGVTLRVERGSYLAILGPNGAGKTTLLKVILGLIEPQRGSVRVFGEAPRRVRGRIGYVPQHPTFDRDFPIRVREVVEMGRLPRAQGARRRLADRDRAVVRDVLEKVEMLPLAERPIGTLSGGEMQRVLIARALALEPELMLLDEPTASLDERIERSVWELLEELSQKLTVVIVSHDIGAISHYVKSVACLNRRLVAHPARELSAEALESTYGCPVELLAHGHPHRVMRAHEPGED